MIKLVFGLNRRADLTHREFGEYWYHEHAELAAELPGLRRYDLSFPDDPDATRYDGVAELYFDERASLEAAVESDVGRAVVADVEQFADPDDVLQLVLEPRTLVDRD